MTRMFVIQTASRHAKASKQHSNVEIIFSLTYIYIIETYICILGSLRHKELFLGGKCRIVIVIADALNPKH